MRPIQLPDFPWDSLEPAIAQAKKYPDGAVFLSIGTPVDDTPQVAQQALRESANSPGYPPAVGTDSLRHSIVDWFVRERHARGMGTESVLPTVGSKELVANLGWQLGLEEGDTVLIPEVAYPTYDICARLAQAQPIPVPFDPGTWPAQATLVWINSPGNPNGYVYSADQLREIVKWARNCGAIVVSDECYATLAWEVQQVPSLLSDEVCEGDYRNLLVAYSLSKESSLAGYRAAFVAGDSALIKRITEIRKHAGFMLPAPTQAAMTACLEHREHVRKQKAVYGTRRVKLRRALEQAGLELDPKSVAGLYLWGQYPGKTAWQLVAAFAKIGVVVAPGDFYGTTCPNHVRISLTACDEDIEKVCERLHNFGLSF